MKKLLFFFLFLTPAQAADTALLDAIEQVESGGRADCVGDKGKAIGAYQIWPIMVDDVNRIYKTKFTYADRWNRDKSRAMAGLYLDHYGKGKTIEQQSRVYNGGPNGHKKKSTQKYWVKIERELKKKGSLK